LDEDSYRALCQPEDCSLIKLHLKGIGDTKAYQWVYQVMVSE